LDEITTPEQLQLFTDITIAKAQLFKRLDESGYNGKKPGLKMEIVKKNESESALTAGAVGRKASFASD
jgi:hypothetical protein